MIDSTFVESVKELGQKAMSPKVLRADTEPPNVYYLHNPQTAKLDRIVGPRSEHRTFTTLESLTRWGWTKPAPKAWVSIDKIQVTTEDEFQSTGIYPIGLAPQAERMIALAKTEQTLDQKQMIRLLRGTFNGCVSESLIALFGKLKFTRNENSEAVLVTNQSANIGKSLTAQVMGVGAIPEVISFDLPMVADPLLVVERQKVSCGLDVDLDAAKFLFFVLPLQMERAVKLTVETLRKLTEAAINPIDEGEHEPGGPVGQFPVYLGKVA